MLDNDPINDECSNDEEARADRRFRSFLKRKSATPEVMTVHDFRSNWQAGKSMELMYSEGWVKVVPYELAESGEEELWLDEWLYAAHPNMLIVGRIARH